MAEHTVVLQMMQLPGELELDAEGRWYHAGIVVAHERIAAYLSRHLQWSGEHGRFVVAVAGRCVAVTVADTAYFAEQLEVEANGLIFLLNTGERERLGQQPLEIGTTAAWYFCSSLKQHSVKLTRPVVQQLIPFVEETVAGGYCLRLAQATIPLQYRKAPEGKEI